MPKLVKLIATRGEAVWVNPEYVERVQRSAENETQVYMVSQSYVFVRGTADEIVDALAE